MKRFLAVLFFMGPVCLLAAERPNIVFILADDTGWSALDIPADPEIPGSGSSYCQTPNTSKLALGGVRFSMAYSPAPTCGPSRTSIQYGQPPSDSKLVKSSLKRISANYGKPGSYTGDRGFDSAKSRADLEDLDIINGICPRSVPALRKKLEDESFCLLQKRKGSTEGRIGLFKNAYLGQPLRGKGFANRKTRIEWCILGHNLWKLATMAAQKRAELDAELAIAA